MLVSMSFDEDDPRGTKLTVMWVMVHGNCCTGQWWLTALPKSQETAVGYRAGYKIRQQTDVNDIQSRYYCLYHVTVNGTSCASVR